jgi:hypothetical protein
MTEENSKRFKFYPANTVIVENVLLCALIWLPIFVILIWFVSLERSLLKKIYLFQNLNSKDLRQKLYAQIPRSRKTREFRGIVTGLIRLILKRHWREVINFMNFFEKCAATLLRWSILLYSFQTEKDRINMNRRKF